MLISTIFQGTLVQEVYVHALHQDQRAQISAGQIKITDIKNHWEFYNQQGTRVLPVNYLSDKSS